MVRFFVAMFLATLLGGCIVLPLDHAYGDGPYYGHPQRHWGDRDRHNDGYRHWRYRERR